MANVLGTLFGDIADSIRGGLGGIGTMKPSAFPERIDEIVALLNAGGGETGDTSTGQLKFADGTFYANEDGTSVTIEHGLGVMPDFIIVQQYLLYSGTAEEYMEDRPLTTSWGFKSAIDAGVWGFVSGTSVCVELANGIDVQGTANGSIYCPDETHFVVQQDSSAANFQLAPPDKARYSWFAISGMGGSVSGGSSEDVRYVTFMSYDGSVEYGKKAVAVGDDCADPIARGVFDTPTRESTVQYNYTFAGWATEANGGLDSNALKAVEEDRTVYANFAAVVRYYTITYYDSNGTTVLKTESLAYGTMPSYMPVKDGYGFDSWNPAATAVTGDASYTAVWTENITFANGTWADIAAISESGQAVDYFAVGDTKTITVGSTSILLRIIGFDHDTLADGSGKTAGMTVFAETALADTMTAPDWATVASKMKTVIKPQLPSDLQAVIKTVLKKCDDVTLLDQTITPTDVEFDLFPLSYDELKILRHSGRLSTDASWRNIIAELGTPYPYFASKHNTVYDGPYVHPWYSSTNSWFRQYFRLSTSANNGLSHSVALNSSASKWANIVAITEEKPVLFAFCI